MISSNKELLIIILGAIICCAFYYLGVYRNKKKTGKVRQNKMNEGMENLKEIEDLEEDKRNLYKIVDKLEKRITTLEKVLESHAKCIGQLREEKDE